MVLCGLVGRLVGWGGVLVVVVVVWGLFCLLFFVVVGVLFVLGFVSFSATLNPPLFSSRSADSTDVRCWELSGEAGPEQRQSV